MTASSIVKRLVEEVGPEPELSEHEEDIPIEYYESKEIARRRVLLRGSFRMHFIFYVAANFLCILFNLKEFQWSLGSIYDFWAAWPLIFWGFLVWVHFWVVKTQNITNIQHRIFFILLIVNFYAAWALIFTNYWGTIQLAGNPTVWWPGTLAILAVFTILVAYFTLFHSNEQRMERNIEKELELMKSEHEQEIKKMNWLIEKSRKDRKRQQPTFEPKKE